LYFNCLLRYAQSRLRVMIRDGGKIIGRKVPKILLHYRERAIELEKKPFAAQHLVCPHQQRNIPARTYNFDLYASKYFFKYTAPTIATTYLPNPNQANHPPFEMPSLPKLGFFSIIFLYWASFDGAYGG